MPRVLSTLFVCALTLVSGVSALNNGLGLTPQMGWNSWNKFACDVSDSLLRSTADALVSSGLASLGYKYLNVDDCWQVSRDNVTGVIQADPVRFPYGMKPLVDYVHSKGLLFGLYSDAGSNTCQGRPGSLGYEKIDASTYASWGVDYLKYDNCNNEGIKPEVRYPPMRDALNATGRPIFFSMCEWGVDAPYKWAPEVGNSYRSTTDISDNWVSMMLNIYQNDASAYAAGPGQWSDPDMLEVGNGGMTDSEYRVHFSLWALAKSPLILGMDLTKLDNATYTIVSNEEIIAINQDPLGIQGTKVSSVNGMDTWAGEIVNGWVVVLVNTNSTPGSVGFNFTEIGAPASADLTVRDLWTHNDIGRFISTFPAVKLQPHSCIMLQLTSTFEHKHERIILRED